MPDEPTLSELSRRLDDRVGDIRDDIRELGARLDNKVDQRLYDLRHESLVARVATLEQLREKDAQKLVDTRRWLIGAVIVPLVGILLPVIILLLQGVGS
jgi:hypothetical protein